MSDNYYNFNSVRKQVLLAEKNGLCSFELYPLEEQQDSIVKNDWSTECKDAPCTKGWCMICLDVSIKGFRTRTVYIYYLVEASIAYVKLFGTISDELETYNIIHVGSLEQIRNTDKIFPESVR
jgi:hypothetical protein